MKEEIHKVDGEGRKTRELAAHAYDGRRLPLAAAASCMCG